MKASKTSTLAAALLLLVATVPTLKAAPEYATSAETNSYRFVSEINEENNLCVLADAMCQQNEQLTAVASEIWQVTQIGEGDSRYNNPSYLTSWHSHCHDVILRYSEATDPGDTPAEQRIDKVLNDIVTLSGNTLQGGNTLDMHLDIVINKSVLIYRIIDGYKEMYSTYTRPNQRRAIDDELAMWLTLYAHIAEFNTYAIYLNYYGGSIAGGIAGSDNVTMLEARVQCLAVDLSKNFAKRRPEMLAVKSSDLLRQRIEELIEKGTILIANSDLPDTKTLQGMLNEMNTLYNDNIKRELDDWIAARQAVAASLNKAQSVRYLNATDGLLFDLSDVLQATSDDYQNNAG